MFHWIEFVGILHESNCIVNNIYMAASRKNKIRKRKHQTRKRKQQTRKRKHQTRKRKHRGGGTSCSKPSRVVPEDKIKNSIELNKVVPYDGDGDDDDLSLLSHDNPHGYHNTPVSSYMLAEKAAKLAAKLAAKSNHDITPNNSVSSGERTRR